jgi:nucleotide-binding universal stress UspA family protein
MNERVKILIGYDGSECAEAALDDLERAGLPVNVEAHVLSVAEVWLPPTPPTHEEFTQPTAELKVPADLKRIYARTSAALKETQERVEQARSRLKTLFPKWDVSVKAESGSPAWEMIFRASQLQPDLIVVGSQGRSALGRFVLGSVSQKVLAEAECSVRIARGRVEEPGSPIRIVIGIDGSPGSLEAVRAVAARKWPAGSEAKLVVVTDPWSVPFVGNLIPPLVETIEEENQAQSEYAGRIAAQAETLLGGSALKVTKVLREGDPKRELPRIAEEWGADCIFVGSTGFSNRLEKLVLGSVSAAVAARAQCSVEVVRKKTRAPEREL